MNRFWLKISAAVVLVIAVFIGAYVFWPVETKLTAGSGTPRQVLKEGKLDLKPRPKVSPYESWIPGPYVKNAQNWEFPGRPPQLHQKQHHFTDKRISIRYPASLQSRKARDSLYKPPEWDYKQNIAADREMRLWYPNSLKTKKSAERLRREPPEGAELKFSEQQIKEMYERRLHHILKRYPNGPQAEKIREILLERLKQRREPHDVADKKASSE